MTITLTREEAQQVLSVLDDLSPQHGRPDDVEESIETLRNKLIAPDVMINGLTEQETAETMSVKGLAQPDPVADKYLMEIECTKCGAKQDGVLTVTAPPQREWQGLTDEEMFDCLAQTDGEAKRLPLGFKWFAEAIEAKLKEKNA